MLKVSTRGRYGLRVMLSLALRYGEGATTIHQIADEQELSRQYAHTLLAALRSAGLVRAVRGPGGGFTLARPPSGISVYDIVRVLEGPIVPVDCISSETLCPRTRACITREVWSELGQAMVHSLQSMTLDVLLVRMAEKGDRLGGCP
jgi:Rrf2 family protein